MRNPTPFASLHDVPFDLVDEYDGDEACFPGGGLCWPDDPLDNVLGYVSVPDDGFLDELGFGACCSPPPQPPPPRPEGSHEDEDAVESVDADGGVGALADEESALCGKRKRSSSACEVFDGVPGLATAVPRPDGGFDTCAAAAAAMEDGFRSEEALALPLPARAPSCSSTSTTTSAASSCPSGLSSVSMYSCPSFSPTMTTTSSCKTESPSTERASVFHPWTVPRKRRSRPAATVRKRPWSLASPLPLVLMPAAIHGSHGDKNNGNDDKEDDFSYSNSSCGSGDGSNVLRRSAGRQRSRQGQRTCTHCQSSETPQWRLGPDGPGTLCNACGIRYKMGKLYPEYRPSTSPSFSSDEHSNRHRKVVKLREKKLKVMAATGLPPVPMTPNTVEVLPLCKYN